MAHHGLTSGSGSTHFLPSSHFFQSQISLSPLPHPPAHPLVSNPDSHLVPSPPNRDHVTWALGLLWFLHAWAPWQAQWPHRTGAPVVSRMEEGSQGLLRWLGAAHGRSYRTVSRFTTKKKMKGVEKRGDMNHSRSAGHVKLEPIPHSRAW